MAVLYVKHHKTPRSHVSFIRYLETRTTSAFFVTFGILLAFIALLTNIVVKISYHPYPKFAQNKTSGGDVQGVTIQNVFTPNDLNPPPAPDQQENTPTPTPTIKLSKSYYTIAAFGDSLEDTMGERMEYLEGALKNKYPGTTFFLYNYGKGSENVEEGLSRFNEDFKYKDRNFPAISKIQADIIIIGSYAYNPFSPHSRDRHWLGLTHLVQEAQKKKEAKVYLLAEIAPLRRTFGRGPGGANWDETTSYTHSGYIVENLENTIGLGKALNVPVIDTYHQSIANEQTREGKRELVDTFDGIHPGVQGQKFIADAIVDSLQLQ